MTEVSDIYISALHLSDRYPEIFRKPASYIKEEVKNEVKISFNSKEKKDQEQRQSKFTLMSSPFNKKGAFPEIGKAIKSGFPRTISNKLDQNFNIVNRGMMPVQKFMNRLRRKIFYKSIEKLTNEHYFLIGDMAANPLDKGASIIDRNRTKLVRDFWGSLSSILVNRLKAGTLLNRLALLRKWADEKIPTFDVNKPLGITWNFIVLALCIAQIFTYSIEKCFGTNIETSGFGFAVILIVWIDLAVKLNTRFYIDGVQILDRRKIFRQVLRTHILTDIVPCICMTPLLFSNKIKDIHDINLVLIMKISSALEIGEKIGDLLIKGERSQSIYDLIILILTILVSAHLVACLWHYIGYTSNINNPEENNWLKQKGLTNENWSVRYLFSVYWGVTTMLTVGYGDISPSNETEIFFNIWAMVLGCGMFGYSMNRIGEILSLAGESKRRQRKRMKKVVKMLREKDVPPETEIKVRKYLEFVWKQEKKEDPQHEKDILEKLSSKLREEILLSTNVKFLKRVGVFKLFSDKALLCLANNMRKVRFSPEEIVYKEKDNDDISIFFVIDGVLESKPWIEKTNPSISTMKKVYRKNDYFGVQEVFSGRPRATGVASLDFSTVFKLSRNDILYILQKFPEDYEKFCRIRDMDIIYENQSIYSIKCESCGFEDHRINECRFLRFVPAKIQLISRYINRKHKTRRSFKRKPHRKENCLIEKDRNREFIEEFLLNYKEDSELLQLSKFYEFRSSEQKLEDSENTSNNNNEEDKLEEQSEEYVPFSVENFGTQKTLKTRTESSHKFKNWSANNIQSGPTVKGSERNLSLVPVHNRDKSHEFKSLSTNTALKHSIRNLVFEKVKSFKHYFPWNNIENVAKKYSYASIKKSSCIKNQTCFT